MPLSFFKAFPTSSQKAPATEDYPVIVAIGMKRLDTFNYSPVTLFHWTSKTKLAAAEDSGYRGLNYSMYANEIAIVPMSLVCVSGGGELSGSLTYFGLCTFNFWPCVLN